jgi:hypothetical protein
MHGAAARRTPDQGFLNSAFGITLGSIFRSRQSRLFSVWDREAFLNFDLQS